jgi:hypothetical protein
MAGQDVYAPPRVVSDVRDCDFYHTTDVPGHGRVEGQWDLRDGVWAYLGNVDVAGKRVLDLGAASGFLSFAMEQRGAEVVSYDLSPDFRGDAIPFAGSDLGRVYASSREHVRRMNNGYWFCHRAFGSKARVVHGTVYAVPAGIGPVDVATCGSILLHLRDPFLALHNVCQLARDRVVVADVVPRRRFLLWTLARMFGTAGSKVLGGRPRFLPSFRGRAHGDGTWWELTPMAVRQFLGVLGFEDSRVTYHTQPYRGSTRLMYTVVARRTAPAPVLAAEPVRAAA